MLLELGSQVPRLAYKSPLKPVVLQRETRLTASSLALQPPGLPTTVTRVTSLFDRDGTSGVLMRKRAHKGPFPHLCINITPYY